MGVRPPPPQPPVDPNTFRAQVDDASHKNHYSFPFRLNADHKLMTITLNKLSAPFIAQGLVDSGYKNAKGATDAIAKLIQQSGDGFIVVPVEWLNDPSKIPAAAPASTKPQADTPPSESPPMPQAQSTPNAASTEPKQALASPQASAATAAAKRAAAKRAAEQAANAKSLGLDPKKNEVATLQQLMAKKEKMPLSIDKAGKADNKAGNETMNTLYRILIDGGSYQNMDAVNEALKSKNALTLMQEALAK